MLQRKMGSFALVLASLSAAVPALASDLQVAAGAPAPPPAPTEVATQAPAPPPPVPARDAAAKPEKVRDKVEFGGTAYVLTGAAIDDGTDGAFLFRPALEVGVNIGLGDLGLFIGGLPLGVEITKSGVRRSITYPAMTVVGVHDDSWLVAVAGGASLATDNNYGDMNDNEVAHPSPRGELRGGYRFGEEGMGEVVAYAGVERRLYDNRDGETRIIAGLSVGVAGR